MRQVIKQIGKNRKWQNTFKYYLLCVVLVVFIFLSLMLPRILSVNQSIVEIYCADIFPVISWLGNKLTSILPFSITETLVVSMIVITPILIVWFIVRVIKLKRRKELIILRIYRRKVLITILIFSLIMSLDFELMHGINYRRTSIPKVLKFKMEHCEYSDYEETLKWAWDNLLKSRYKIDKSKENGKFFLNNINELSKECNKAIDDISDKLNLNLSHNFSRIKPVMLSHYWSYTDIIGLYDCFIGETMVNSDYVNIIDFPLTVAHEISHSKGVARENDANTVATIALINTNIPELEYAGYYEIFSTLYGYTYAFSREEGKDFFLEVPLSKYENKTTNEAMIAKKVVGDIIKKQKYWESIKEEMKKNALIDKIDDIAEWYNNLYLKANNQEGGTKTYNVLPNVYVEYYFSNVKGD